MKKVNLNFDLVNLDGVKVSTAGKIVSGLLMSEMKGDSEKLFDWAMCFNREEEVSMDGTDFERFKDLITKTERLSVMVKVPIVKYLKTIK